MRRTISLKLVGAPDAECQATVDAYRAACDEISTAIKTGERANTRSLQTTHYARLRETLPAQMACSVFRTVVGAWKSWRGNGSIGEPPSFHRSVASLQEGRDWTLKEDGTVSLRTLTGRIRLPYLTSHTGHQHLNTAKTIGGLGAASLIHKRRGWFLEASLDMPTPPTYEPRMAVGVDVGIRVLAVARAPGTQPLVIRGGDVRRRRNDAYRLRRRLQRKGTRSARRVLRNLAGVEERFVRDRVRVAAKAIVAYAKTHQAEIRMEDLTGVRLGKRWGKGGNRRLHSWAFRRLQSAIADRAEAMGVPVAWVGPAYTSQSCPKCEHVERANRNGPRFRCRVCGYRNHADVVGASNIAIRLGDAMVVAMRARVNGPDGRVDEGRVLLHTVQTPAQTTDINRR